MATQRFCPVCGNDIVFDYVHQIKSFRIDENENFVRDDNNDIFHSENPFIDFYCSEDREHSLGDSFEQIQWQEDVSQEFFNMG